jgi:putative ABC transport system substrate-binding protein
MMNRRTFAGAVAVGLTAPLAAWAQQARKNPRIGLLVPGAGTSGQVVEAFRQGMRDLGYIDTSFNLHGEPIVCTAAGAEETFERSGSRTSPSAIG